MRESQHLLTDLQHPRPDGDHVAGHQFSLVGDVLLDAGHPTVRLAQERRSESDCGEDNPGSLVELAHVPHDVHVPHMVAMPGVDHTAVGNQRVLHFGTITQRALWYIACDGWP